MNEVKPMKPTELFEALVFFNNVIDAKLTKEKLIFDIVLHNSLIEDNCNFFEISSQIDDIHKITHLLLEHVKDYPKNMTIYFDFDNMDDDIFFMRFKINTSGII